MSETPFFNAVQAIGDRQVAAQAMLRVLKDLQAWGVMMGGWQSSPWRALDTVIKQAEDAGIVPAEETNDE